MRFYHLDPERILTLPTYLLEILIEHLPALDADEMYQNIVTALAPNMEENDRKTLLDDLESLTKPLKPVEMEPAKEFHFTKDPIKAAEFFASMGIKTQSSG